MIISWYDGAWCYIISLFWCRPKYLGRKPSLGRGVLGLDWQV